MQRLSAPGQSAAAAVAGAVRRPAAQSARASGRRAAAATGIAAENPAGRGKSRARQTARMRSLLGAGREAVRVLRADTVTHGHFRDRLVAIATATILVDLVCSVLVLLLERHVHGTQITGYGSALFFSTTQLLSVSSSFANPLSPGGQVLDVLMELYAITVVAALAGATGSFLQHRSIERRADAAVCAPSPL